MAQRGGFWGALLGYSPPPRDRFSVEELRHLHDTLIRNANVTDANRDVVVETLRSIAELMIWGDQHEPRFFDYFAENNVLQHFTQFLQKKANRRGDVAQQVLQTLSMLIYNIRSEVAIFYLFSNNHVNDIVALRFDFEDDEVLGYYINLLKTIALKLNKSTVQFFFQEENGGTFPLYTEAVKFINHRDGLVRAAVRTLTLSVYSIKEPGVQAFVLRKPAVQYFTRLTGYLIEQCQSLDRLVSSLTGNASSSMQATLDSCLGEVEDLLTYCDDVMATGEQKLAEKLQQCLWDKWAGPVLLWPLHSLHSPDDPHPPGQRSLVQPLTALYITERLLHVMRTTAFTHRLAQSLTLPGGTFPPTPPASAQSSPSRRQQADLGPALQSHHLANGELSPDLLSSSPEDGGAIPAVSSSPAQEHRPPEQSLPPPLLAALTSTHGIIAGAAAHALGALLKWCTQGGDGQDVLVRAGLQPHRLRKNRELLEALTSSSSGADRSSLERGGSARGEQQGSEQASTSQSDAQTSEHQPAGQQGQQQGELGAHWVEALCLMCALQVLPPSALAMAGCLLLQLVSSGSEMTSRQRVLLRRAGEVVGTAVRREVAGQWCDALPLLTCLVWGPCRASLGSPGLASTSSVIQSWIEAVSVEEASRSGYLVGEPPPDTSGQTRKGAWDSARAAQRAYHTIQRFVLLLQIRQGLTGDSRVSDSAPLHPVTEAVVRAAETREGSVVLLPDAISCSVSFAQGAEKSVLLGVAGLPQLQEHGAAENPLAVTGSAAAVVLATRREQPFSGVALSIAPLLGSSAYVDPAHPKWLHLHVRPHARGLAKTVRNGGPQGAMRLISTQLLDGHWVLSFADPGAALAARALVHRCAKELRQRFADCLEPLVQSLYEGDVH
ncbi:hypothetical protein WJX73_003927 [Symbiochloris irregularis]|uniref:FPL domain-containing protein n=1 Tax=Symbiochloris irregularis TaxID=706552 RepID=A0AAW1NS21_9CHLO